MYNVAVCDDTEEERLQAAEYAGRFFEREGIEVRIDTYAAGRELLESGREYDLYLLDVLMPGMSGIDTAQALAEDKDHPVVVFITSSLESAVEGYRVEAAGFILKPVEEENFWSTMERVVRRRLGLKKAVLSVVHNRVNVELPLERLAWFENRLHRVFVKLTDGEVLSVNQKLSEAGSGTPCPVPALPSELPCESGLCGQAGRFLFLHAGRTDDSHIQELL